MWLTLREPQALGGQAKRRSGRAGETRFAELREPGLPQLDLGGRRNPHPPFGRNTAE